MKEKTRRKPIADRGKVSESLSRESERGDRELLSSEFSPLDSKCESNEHPQSHKKPLIR